MSEKRKISFKKVLRFAVGALLVVIFMIALAAASREQDSKTINGFEVHLNDEPEYSFLQKKDIENQLLNNRDIQLSTRSIRDLDLKKMEAIAETNPWVANAEIYVDNRRILQIDVVQRKPIARIFDVFGNSYYMDSSFRQMPVRVGYTYPAVVFTNVPVYSSDSLNKILKAKMVYLSEVIGADSFWNAQISQIEVQPDQTFIATPLLGNQQIIIGDTDRIHEKLFNLLAFYKHVPEKRGWDAYKTLDLRFKGQIVAAPAMDATLPKVSIAQMEQNEPPTEPPVKAMPSKLSKPELQKQKEPVKRIKVNPGKGKGHQPKYIYKG
jgi:cell division protein FtsQ